jgi:hypothetical protein
MLDNLKINIIWIVENFSFHKSFQFYLERIRKKHQEKLIKNYIPENPRHLEFVEVDYLTPELFRELYKKHEPFVIRGGAKEWSCVKKWSFEFFQKNYGGVKLPFLETRQYDGAAYEETTIDVAVKAFKNGSKKYCKFSDTLYQVPELQKDLNLKFLKKFKTKISQTGTYQFFLGPKDTSTRLHNAIGNNFFIQIWGEKTWKIYPMKYTHLFCPKTTRSPHFISSENFAFPHEHEIVGDTISHWEIHLGPGDILFNPTYLWHTVHNDTDSIAVKCSWASPRSFFRNPTMTLLTLAAFGGNLFKLRRILREGKFTPKKLWM